MIRFLSFFFFFSPNYLLSYFYSILFLFSVSFYFKYNSEATIFEKSWDPTAQF